MSGYSETPGFVVSGTLPTTVDWRRSTYQCNGTNRASLNCVRYAALLLIGGCVHADVPKEVVWATTSDDLPARWHPDSLPLFVVLSPVVGAWQPVFEEGVEYWNDTLGRTAFVLGAPRNIPAPELRAGNGPVVVLPGNGFTTRWWAAPTTGQILFALIEVDDFEGPPETALALVRHELGHVLGLGHDPPGNSLMAEHIQAGTTYLLCPVDREQLRRWYLFSGASPVTETPPIPGT